MCFTNDNYDWVAEVCEVVDTHNWRYGTWCIECGEVIPLYARMRVIDQQEHAECHCEHCENQYILDCWEYNAEECTHELGESWHGVQCECCVKMLAAIKDVEIAEGCRERESQPAYGDLGDELLQMEPERASRYLQRAETMFPGYDFRGLVSRKQPGE